MNINQEELWHHSQRESSYNYCSQAWYGDGVDLEMHPHNAATRFTAAQPSQLHLLQGTSSAIDELNQNDGDSWFHYSVGRAAVGSSCGLSKVTDHLEGKCNNTQNDSPILLELTNEGKYSRLPLQYQATCSNDTILRNNSSDNYQSQEGFHNYQVCGDINNNTFSLQTSNLNLPIHTENLSVVQEYQDFNGVNYGQKAFPVSERLNYWINNNSNLTATTHLQFQTEEKILNKLNQYQGSSWFDYENECFIPSDALHSIQKQHKGYQDLAPYTASCSQDSALLPQASSISLPNDDTNISGSSNEIQDTPNVLRMDEISRDSGFLSNASSEADVNISDTDTDMGFEKEAEVTEGQECEAIVQGNESFSDFFRNDKHGNGNSYSSSPTEKFDDLSEVQTLKTRKRKRNQDFWIQHSAKKSRNSGLSGVSKRGKPIKSRSMAPPCTCRSQCSDKCNESERRRLFKRFWELNDHNRQWDYLARKMKVNEPKERKILLPANDKPRKNNSVTYILSVNTKDVKVCRTMFLNTFGISRKWLETICTKKKLAEGDFINPDMRGKHMKRGNKASESIVNSVHEHINMFPRVESHYCRQNSSKDYLTGDLNISKMYRLYKDWMKDKEEVSYASESFYRSIFSNSYNISFHQPKKDQCDTCFTYDHLSNEDKGIKKLDHDNHFHKKDIARSLMNKDIEDAKENDCIACVQFDLQKVLCLPQSETSVMYYKRKISLYNFTFYNLSTKEVLCKVWNETTAGRGSNEFSSHLYSYIRNLSQQSKEDIRFISDNCSGQNKNKHLFKMYIIASKEFNVKITHRYLLTGHTQSAGDSVHSAIERAARKKSIFSQDDWCSIIQKSKVKEPKYIVHQVSQSEIFDFSETSNSTFWNKMKISQISSISFFPDGKIKCCYNYEEANTIFTAPKMKSILKNCYTAKLPLSLEKKKDIKDLCDKNLIPQQYHDFYRNLLN